MKVVWVTAREQTLEDYDRVKMSNRCDCPCHDGRGIMHCFPCCDPCPYCREDRILDLRGHLECCTNYLFHHNQGD